MSKIFISIASYRDPELVPTIKNIISQSKYPENITFGICRQYHENDKFDNLDEWKNDNRFNIINVEYYQSKGVCWARNKIQKLYNGEDYYLQIDSHHRFIKNWDDILIKMLIDIRKDGHEKPLISTYCPSYYIENGIEYRIDDLKILNFGRFSHQGPIFTTTDSMENLDNPVPNRFISGHFIFTLGDFCKEVIYYPEIYFHGEEICISVRSFTYGYDVFCPNKLILWHQYNINGNVNRRRHWDDQSSKNFDTISYLKIKKLFGMDGCIQDTDEYGFGNKRTLRDYEIWSGILFSERGVQKYTLEKKLPPNIEKYKNEYDWKFVEKIADLTCMISLENIIDLYENDPNSIVLMSDNNYYCKKSIRDWLLKSNLLPTRNEALRIDFDRLQIEWNVNKKIRK